MFIAAKMRYFKKEFEPAMAILNKSAQLRSQFKHKNDLQTIETAFY